MVIKEEVSIKVHCIVSCLCEVIRERSDYDYRPFYIGLWDAPFDVTEDGQITYYQHDLDHSHYFQWYEKLFGAPVHEWYDAALSIEANLERMLDLIEHSPPDRYIMAQIDLSLMPERENKFHQKPFPHFLILAKTECEDEWQMIDADFRWQGIVQKDRVIQAFLENPFGGGFYVDSDRVMEPTREAVAAYFKEVFHWENELTDTLRNRLAAIGRGDTGFTVDMVEKAVKQLPVLAIRKYSYEHALMYFIEETGSSDEMFEAYTDKVELLVRGFHNIQYQGMKFAMIGNGSQLPAILRKLEEMDKVEKEIKRELYRLYGLWEAMP
ncbi:Petrobactin biosynthesis protein AsbE [Paenibacillus sp. 1011MAR3C5]|uniref:DUF6005 family protein n=1 Tax=Paenibacillus sp. 1011MAR3C5 TaxID=1675787 RepID=UPI000E6CBF1C|nr:DUF6005 family protein [Paenibacillus sp. 1011MAR3C5]RJE87517.1 Petrobactin biosynthesis protein AsbE [Paenibacillus sp. 1011MAR3C5]